MISAVRFIHRTIGLPLDEALRMASLYPAEVDGRRSDATAASPPAPSPTWCTFPTISSCGDVWIKGRKVF